MVGRDIGDTYAKLKRNEKIGDVILEKDLAKMYMTCLTPRRGRC